VTLAKTRSGGIQLRVCQDKTSVRVGGRLQGFPESFITEWCEHWHGSLAVLCSRSRSRSSSRSRSRSRSPSARNPTRYVLVSTRRSTLNGLGAGAAAPASATADAPAAAAPAFSLGAGRGSGTRIGFTTS
jgi:hypothetical protein